MKKSALICVCVGLLVLAAGLFVANKDLLLGDGETTTGQTVENAGKEETATVVPTTLPTTQTTTETTTEFTTAKPTTTRPKFTNPAFVAENITGAPSANAGTFTGYMPLNSVKFSVNDPDNSRGLPTSVINHSFGVAKEGKPHQISVDSQKFFETKGYNAITYDTKSTDKVLYLTFDCGYENGYTFNVLDTLKEKKVSAAFFCTLDHIEAEPELISRMIKEGHIVGNHSANHPNFSKISRTKMAEEIAECDNFLRKNFGYTSPYFRFPEGAYTESALDLVESLGYKSVFWSLAYSDWDTSKQKGAQYAFDTVTARLHPGAIILLHSVSKDNAEALGDIIDYALSQGYVFKPLTALPK
ncbi:MAG: polysaccharide deacetylase family protein [Clostridia bacterium]|nr:polysaccharide deacetylase family protein [Clostridia bacterium]